MDQRQIPTDRIPRSPSTTTYQREMSAMGRDRRVRGRTGTIGMGGRSWSRADRILYIRMRLLDSHVLGRRCYHEISHRLLALDRLERQARQLEQQLVGGAR